MSLRKEGHNSSRIFTRKLHRISSWSARTIRYSRFCFGMLRSKQTASKSPVSGLPSWIYPDGRSSSDSEPLAGGAIPANSVCITSQPKREIPPMSKDGNEYRDSKEVNESGKRLGNFSSRFRKREALSSRRIG